MIIEININFSNQVLDIEANSVSEINIDFKTTQVRVSAVGALQFGGSTQTSGGGEWGYITGDIENQTDLIDYIDNNSGGITALNGLTDQVQNLAVGTTGTDFAISSISPTHTFNLPTASVTNRGALSSADWTTFNGKVSSVSAGTNISITGTATSPIVNKLNSERRNDWVAPYSYCGSAPNGSAVSASVWTIYRIQVASDGTVTTLSATKVKWTDRLTVNYT